ncbi:Ig-like domain-containing protein [Vibrio sp.]|uniref:Ig-like domain-containing protein n=1 Tax=Vibrio sp. TaxID=678 RepID=UPI003D095ABF
MKKQKIWFLLLMGVIIISSIQVNPIQAQGEGGTPTFGLEINNSATVEKVDGDAGEPKNHWVHKNGLMWSEVQKNGPTSNWDVPHVTQLDDYIETISAAGMEVILTIRSTPDWAQKYQDPGLYCGPMAEGFFDEFAYFVAEAVSRYSQPPYNVKYYEIWNEPDAPYLYFLNSPTAPFGCWGDPYDPQGYFGGGYYGEMLKAVYPALKIAAPDAQLVIGGLLMPADPEIYPWDSWVRPGDDWVYAEMSKFFEGILVECQGTECFDFVNFHGYTYYGRNKTAIELEKETYDNFWDDRGGQVEGKLSYLRELMDIYFVDKPVILTEAALLGDNIVDYDPAFEATKADYIVWLYARNLAKGIYATTWYHLDNYGWRRSGLLDRNNNPLPAYDAYTVLTDMLDGAIYQGDLSLGEGILGFEFSGDTNYWVLFSEDGTTKQIRADQLPPWFHSANNLFGDQITNQRTTISFNWPIYIKGNTAPVAVDDFYILNEGAPIKVRAPGVLRNDINYDGDALTAVKVSDPSYGDLILNSNGSFTYTPGEPFPGEDSFTYLVSDGMFDSEPATVTILDGTWLFLPLIHR